MKNYKTTALTLAVGAGLIGNALAAPAPRVLINGQALRSESPAFVQNSRVLVPMRDIFESLGATVNYNSLDRSISAQRGTTIVRMLIGSSRASVNNVPVALDVPAATYSGNTYVPLRFVSEAMGADVKYDSYNSLVSIKGQGYTGGTVIAGGNNGGTQIGGTQQISIPANSVVPVTIDEELNSATTPQGKRFTATVVSQTEGDSEFPAGTKLSGVVVGVTRRTSAIPGTLDLRFIGATLPDNTRVALRGQLISLDSDSVQTTGGRVTAVGNARKKNNTLKVVGIGAGAGFVIGKLLKKDGALPAILGAAGGFLYDQLGKKNKTADARLNAGTRLGVRLENPITYRDTLGYAPRRADRLSF